MPKVLGLREVLLLGLEGLFVAFFFKIAEDVSTRESFHFDHGILLFIHAYFSPWLGQLISGTTVMGSVMVIVSVIFVVGMWFLIGARRRSAVTLTLAGIVSFLLNLILKFSFRRPRPNFHWAPVPHSYGFPSGHTTLSVAVYGMTAYLLSKRYPQLRPWLESITSILLLGIGLSRLYLGVHWPTDVLGGFAAGGLTLFALVYGYNKDYRIFSLVGKWLQVNRKKGRRIHEP